MTKAPRLRAMKRALRMGGVAIWLLYAAPAEAKPQRFDIPAQDLAPALSTFGVQSGLQLIYTPSVLEAKRSARVQGVYEPQAALSALLAGTGLAFTERNGVLVVESVSGPKRAGAELAPATQTAQTASAAAPVSVAEARPQEIVVTAQKREELLREVPVPVTVLGARQLVESNQLRIQDYFSKVPGVQLAQRQNDQYIAIRGVITGQTTNPTVGVMIDDVPYNASTNLGGGNNVPDVDPADLARIEVLRGPQGTLYGANSMGGLLKFVTIDPSTAGVSGRAQVGLNGVQNGSGIGYDVRGAVNMPLSDTLAVRASAFTRQDPGFIDNPVLGLNGVNESHVRGGRLSALWQPSDKVSLKLGALYQKTEIDGRFYVQLLPGLGDLQQNNRRNTGWSLREVQSYTATLRADLGAAELTSNTGYSITRVSDSFDYDYQLGSVTSGVFGTTGTDLLNALQVDKFSQEMRLSSNPGQKLEWLVGGFFTHESSDAYSKINAINPATGNFVGNGLLLLFPFVLDEYAAFADVTYHFTDTFDVQVGARGSVLHQSTQQTDTGPFTPTFTGLPSPAVYPRADARNYAVTYLVTPRLKLSPDLMVYARLASGYRPGGPNLAAGSAAPAQFGPDKTKNYEIGVKGSFLDNKLSVDASIYYIDWSNIQLQSINPLTRLSFNFNGSSAKSQGLELSIEARPLPGLTLSGWIAVGDAELTQKLPANASFAGASGDRLPTSTRMSGNVAIDYEFPLVRDWRGFGGVSASYVGDRLGLFRAAGLPRQEYPEYVKTDLRLGVHNGDWTATVYANNIADERGVLNGGLGFSPPYAFIYIQPRTIGVTLSRSF